MLSTNGSFNVDGASGRDEDLMVFNPIGFGPSTIGSFELYFDGSNVDLAGEDLEGGSIDPVTGDIHLAVGSTFAVPGASGDNADIFTCTPDSVGTNTSCTYSLLSDCSTRGLSHSGMTGVSGSQADDPSFWSGLGEVTP